MENRILNTTYSRINIPEVDISADGPFCMSFCFDLEKLKGSISKYGILNPPYIVKNSDGCFFAVAGYRRLLAAKELGWESAECRILPDGFPAFDALILNLDDNLLHRELNIIEKAMVIERLIPFLNKEKIIKYYMPLLEIPAYYQNLKIYLKLSELDYQIKVSIAEGKLSLRVAELMESMEKDDCLSVNDVFTSLKFSFNQQLQLIQYLTEISCREGCSIKKIIDGSEIREILTEKRVNAPQKANAVALALKRRRFPTLSDAERIFNKGISHLSLPPGVSISPPAFFEGVNYRLEIVFSKGKDLKKKLTLLNKLSGLFDVTEFWKGRGDN